MVRKIVSTRRRLVLTANEGFMELTERKAKIIEAIIKNYQKTGEPVGSRTISKDTDLNVSSATIRNEMADLEEMGLIMSPHTSAGRVPTDLAYRMYVEKLMVYFAMVFSFVIQLIQMRYNKNLRKYQIDGPKDIDD